MLTDSKVKQAIAWQRIIPFYRFFGKQDPTFDSPGGALLMQWFFTCIPLAVLNSSSDARAFFSGIYLYGYQIMMGRCKKCRGQSVTRELMLICPASLGIGLFRLKGRMRQLRHNWRPTYMRNDFVLAFIAFVFFGMNIVILVMIALPEDPDTIPRFYWPISMAAVIAFGLLYWGALRVFQVPEDQGDTRSSIGSKVGLKINVYEEGDDNVPIEMRFLMRDAVGDGSRRRVDYKVRLVQITP
jgi:amino acid transporter